MGADCVEMAEGMSVNQNSNKKGRWVSGATATEFEANFQQHCKKILWSREQTILAKKNRFPKGCRPKNNNNNKATLPRRIKRTVRFTFWYSCYICYILRKLSSRRSSLLKQCVLPCDRSEKKKIPENAESKLKPVYIPELGKKPDPGTHLLEPGGKLAPDELSHVLLAFRWVAGR